MQYLIEAGCYKKSPDNVTAVAVAYVCDESLVAVSMGGSVKAAAVTSIGVSVMTVAAVHDAVDVTVA